MNVKRALIALVACSIATGSIGAQAGRPRTRATAAMWTALQLTESQKTRVDAIHGKYLSAMKVARKQSSDSASAIFQREMSEVRTLLTPSQQEMFDTYMNSDGMRVRRASVAKVVPVRVAIPH